MMTRAISRSGEPIPVIGLGTWKTFDVGPTAYPSRAAVLRRFVDLGGRLVDSSPMYGRAEAVVGDLAAREGLAGALFVATKVWTQGAREGAAQMEASLRRLRVPQVDLMQVHNLVDVETHLRTLAGWKAEGKVRYVGVTHYTVESHAALETFLGRGDIDFIQCNYSLAVREAEARLLPMAAAHGVAVIINRPFENGAVFGRVRGVTLPPVVRELGCTSWAQAFLKYAISHPAVTCVIPATSSVAHLEDNLAAAGEPLPDAALRRRLAQAWEAAV